MQWCHNKARQMIIPCVFFTFTPLSWAFSKVLSPHARRHSSFRTLKPQLPFFLLNFAQYRQDCCVSCLLRAVRRNNKRFVDFRLIGKEPFTHMAALNDIFLFYLHYIKSVVAISCSLAFALSVENHDQTGHNHQSFSGLQAMIQYCGTAV